MADQMSAREFEDSEGLGDWRVLSDGAAAFFRTGSFSESASFVQAIADVTGLTDHPPAVDLRAGGVTVRLVTLTDDFMGMTTRDVDAARRVSEIARDMGLSADPSAVQSFVIVPGAPDAAAVMPFWRAMLGYEPRPDSPDEDLVDPQDRGPGFWFETMAEARADGNGAIHVAIFVPYEMAQGRVDAVLAAGGRMVRDEFAPAWWTLSDPAGNEADIATIRPRD